MNLIYLSCYEKNNMIKWYLKGLCILWLTLLPISFSSAWNATINNVWFWEDLWWNNYCMIDSNLAFMCSETDNVLVSQGNIWNETHSVSYFWLDEWLGFIQYRSNSNDQYYWQWIMTWFQFCTYNFIWNNSLAINNDYWNWPNSCLWRVYTYEEFREYVSTHDLKGWWFISNRTAKWFGWPAFVFEDWAFRATSNPYNWNATIWYWTSKSYNFNISWPWLQADFSNLSILPNPIVAIVPDYSMWDSDTITNTDALIWFESMWLSQEYCYWWFALDNIFLPNEQFEDFSGYSFWNGASIFDLYNAYSWNNTLRVFAWQYKQAFVNWQLSSFHNKSKALLMFYQQIDSANSRGWGSFQVWDTLDYCSLVNKMVDCNWTCDWDIYTWWNRNAINNWKINSNNNNWWFNTTWVLNINQYTWFSTPDDFFWRLNALFQNNIKAWEDNIVWVLPWYIILFMLALILFRMLSH